MSLEERIKATIRDVVDYPKPGILFKDITPVLSHPALVREIIQGFAEQFRQTPVDAVAAVEARGFIFGSVLAHELQVPFIPVRKAGKLPYRTVSRSYDLEYGSASIEMHEDALKPGWRVLIHDDLLATGGTAAAAGHLVRDFNAEIAGFSFLVNLSFLPGESTLKRDFGTAPKFLVNY